MPDFERVSIVVGSEFRPRARYSWAWHTKAVCATLPIVIVAVLDDIARETGRSRSLVISDALRAHPDIAAALASLNLPSLKLASLKVEG